MEAPKKWWSPVPNRPPLLTFIQLANLASSLALAGNELIKSISASLALPELEGLKPKHQICSYLSITGVPALVMSNRKPRYLGLMDGGRCDNIGRFAIA